MTTNASGPGRRSASSVASSAIVSASARQKFDVLAAKLLAMLLAPPIPLAVWYAAALALPSPTYGGGNDMLTVFGPVSFVAIPFAWLFTPLAVFGFFGGRMDSLPRLCAVALLFGFVPALVVSAFGKGGNAIGISALVIALSIAFLTWWLGLMFERARRALVAKH